MAPLLPISVFAAAILLAAPHALAHDPAAPAIGEAGQASQAKRTIRVTMSDAMRFSPSHITVKRGETIRFLVKNDGIEPHEFMLGEIGALREHAEVMRQHPTMEHDEPNAITVNPGQTGTLVWSFTTAGRVDFACLIPGHFEKGMQGNISVSH